MAEALLLVELSEAIRKSARGGDHCEEPPMLRFRLRQYMTA